MKEGKWTAPLLAAFAAVSLFAGAINADAAELNKREKDYLNIKEWHEAGYTGKGVTILVDDTGYIDFNSGNFKEKVKPVYGMTQGHKDGANDGNSHAFQTVALVKSLAPDANIVVHTMEMSGLNFYGLQYAAENDVQIFTRSMSPRTTPYYPDSVLPVFEKKIFLNAAAGNYGSEKISIHAREDEWFITGAARLNGNTPVRESYSSVGEGLDVMGLTRWEVNEWDDDRYPTEFFYGTSASTPVVSSMAALYSEFYKEKTGDFPNADEIRAFIEENVRDMETPGYDTNTGHGLFTLPQNPQDAKIHIFDDEESHPILPAFTDINNSWAKDLILEMATRDIITGYPDGTFKPSKEIDRGQVAALFDRALDLQPIRPSKEFKDVPKNHMYYDEIQAVYRAGIFDGTNGNFRPGESLSRAQMAKIITIAFNLKPKSEANLSDVKDLWVEDYVNAMYTNGITTGSNGEYLPNKKVTREHYAAFLYRALNAK